jgi:hypothetical protein
MAIKAHDKQSLINSQNREPSGLVRAFKQFLLSHCDRVALDALLHYLKGVKNETRSHIKR